VPHLGSIIAINVLLGWTLVGWVVALAMALRTIPEPLESQAVQQAAVVPVAPATDEPDATVTGIAKLADLRREGLLTEDEYAAAKARLLHPDGGTQAS
jgi:hypothetical protein